jgi:cysteine-rich repeat protein
MPQEAEPNDTPAAALAGNLWTPDVDIAGTWSVPGDQDFYAVTVPAGASLRVETFDITGAPDCLFTDTVVELLDTDGTTELARDDDGGVSYCSHIEPAYHPGAAGLAGGTYYVRVKEWSDWGDGPGDQAGTYRVVLTLLVPTCGDGVVEPGEECDDGNTASCDGCNRLCEPEGCGNNVRECLEECDDGNTSTCDGCTPTCLTEACGNHRVDCGEECDEGDQNGLPSSGCLADLCRPGELCTTESTGPCIPCGTPVDCDPLGRCADVDCAAGVCTAAPLACDDANPCTLEGCDALTGCTHALRDGATVPECDDQDPCTDPVCTEAGCSQTAKAGFDSARCRLDDLEGMLADDALDQKARTALGKLHKGAAAKVETAAVAAAAGKTGKAQAKLRSAAQKVARFAKKVVRLQPTHITDPNVGAQLSERSDDALARIEALRTALGD